MINNIVKITEVERWKTKVGGIKMMVILDKSLLFSQPQR